MGSQAPKTSRPSIMRGKCFTSATYQKTVNRVKHLGQHHDKDPAGRQISVSDQHRLGQHHEHDPASRQIAL